jgi:hypothetical protein
MAAAPPAGPGRPLLQLALWQPQLLLDHALACGELGVAEGALALQQWRQRALWALLAVAGLVLAAALAGTALMLWAALPTGSLPHPQWLVGVPLPALLLGLGSAFAARRGAPPAFGLLRQQLAADLQRLREAAAQPPAP